MKQTLEKAAKEYADGLYDPDDRDVLYKETQKDFVAGAKWQANQPLSQEQIDIKLSEYINSTKSEDKLKIGQFSLITNHCLRFIKKLPASKRRATSR